ncbi:glutaredoxin domain-containing protein [Cystoisospora suis]|uniref:Glutaredoxin domain-containing protein n=1 Tax=Cystoisospora suis TaxID=483139 RepID=A0A2C6KQ59_9APIC|nr:glutaredoxin domain-containing protein [Cystoisospora suis]
MKSGQENSSSVATACGVEQVPTACFFEDGEYLGKFVGADPPQVIEALMAWTNIGKDSLRTSLHSMQRQHQLPLQSTTEKKGETLDDRLRRLTTSHPVMVFMKGHRDAPFCRFSKQLMAIFADQRLVHFGAFDVFQDEAVREGLKKFSNWPTYPQVYVQGELIGGVDIIEAMVEDGSFRSAFPKEAFAS